MKQPNFFLIGASKSGTTSIYHYLNQHPEIFMCPEKEPSFFLFPNDTPQLVLPEGLMSSSFRKNIKNTPRVFPTRDEYMAMFKDVRGERIIGEASPDYLIGSETPRAIFEFAPGARIMVILRNPFDAAYSEFLMNQRDGEFIEGVTFLEVLKAEDLSDDDLQKLPKFIRTRFYHTHIKRYLDFFPREQIRFFLFEDLDNTEKLLNEVFEFLEVSTEVEIDFSLKYNAGSVQKVNPRLEALSGKVPPLLKNSLKKLLPTSLYTWYWNRRLGVHQTEKKPVECPEEAREYLLPVFTPVIQELEGLIERDLSSWLE